MIIENTKGCLDHAPWEIVHIIPVLEWFIRCGAIQSERQFFVFGLLAFMSAHFYGVVDYENEYHLTQLVDGDRRCIRPIVYRN